MGDSVLEVGNDLDVRTECPYSSYRKDFDGDYDIYCRCLKSCPHKKIVKDCDGDYVSLCEMPYKGENK